MPRTRHATLYVTRYCFCRVWVSIANCNCHTQGRYCPAVAHCVCKVLELGERPRINLYLRVLACDVALSPPPPPGLPQCCRCPHLPTVCTSRVIHTFCQRICGSCIIDSSPPPSWGCYCLAVANRVYKASELGKRPRINLKGGAIDHFVFASSPPRPSPPLLSPKNTTCQLEDALSYAFHVSAPVSVPFMCLCAGSLLPCSCQPCAQGIRVG